ncbi:MAG: hypothetical protein OEW88_04620 [Gammaproteobacteria bacterium]|nr:hypothetical protein [Gammaproteobacteria bacterium]MDH5275689.1 hypothetical protein [Gammaproteobacteria bacterium]
MPRSARVGLLWLLQLLFVGRVLGQVYVGIYAPAWLPPWPEWYSGLLPYPWLLLSQILIIMLMTATSYDFTRGAGALLVESARARRLLRYVSALYAGAMLVRYAVTMVVAPEMRWLHGAIPIAFHLVLAAYIALLTVPAGTSPARTA